MTEPLIFTTKGNVPVSTLIRAVAWEFSPTQITVKETYTDDAGEVVKESRDIFILPANMQIEYKEGLLNG